MKTKLLVILCVLIFAGVAMVGPVAAASAAAAITGNPVAEIAITVNTTATEIALVQGSNINQTLSVNVKANPIGWTLGVRDDMVSAPAKPVGTDGHMTNWTGTEWATPATTLISHMFIQGADWPVYATRNDEVELTGANQQLELGVRATPDIGWDFIMTTRQPVVYEDRSLAGDNKYRLVLGFTGAVT